MRKIFIQGAIPVDYIAESIQKHSTKTEIGGHSIFLGQVRADKQQDKEVKAIEFTAYEEMAERKYARIREEIFDKYKLTCMHVYHSIGRVEKGGICLFVFVSSRHRKPAIMACDEMVERIKKEVPIWGKELFDDDSYEWKENK